MPRTTFRAGRPAGRRAWVTRVQRTFPAWHNSIGLGWVMVCFAVLCVAAIGFVYRFLPETKGLSVEQTVSVFERQASWDKAGAVT